jgi:shikimate dehydrogenase
MKALSGKARLAGVMGWPVSHSRSPRLHGFWLERYGIDGAYVPLAVRPEDLGPALAALPRLGFRGVNLTVPHKEAGLAIVAEVSAEARRIGAVNTVVVGSDGRLIGHNSDGFGFLANLRQGAPDWHASDGPAVVLGAGGAARAVAAALLDEGVAEVRLVNRTPGRAQGLAHDLGGPCRVMAWAERAAALAGAAVLVNTTTLGMTGAPALELDLSRLPPQAVVNDIVYTPLETPLLAEARQRGNRVVDGLGMLLHQARPGFEAWFGVKPEVTPDLRAFVLEDLRP